MTSNDKVSSFSEGSPVLSIILPVYNGQQYVAEAINSILSQSYKDFELIILDDGSSDGSAAIIEKFNDSRIRSYQHSNKGLAATLNRGISLARGDYIARQDQDDVSFLARLEKQIAFLDANPSVGMVGASAEIWVGHERTKRLLSHPADDAVLRFGLLFDNYFVHSSVVMRRAVLDKVGGYCEDRSRQPPEDYELWSRIMRKYKVANLPDVLMAYREVPGSMSRTGFNPFVNNLIRISSENIAWASGASIDKSEVVALAQLSRGNYDHIPAGINFAGIEAILNSAANGIGADAEGLPPQLRRAVRAHLRKVRCHYINYRSGGLIGKFLNSRIRRFVNGLSSE